MKITLCWAIFGWHKFTKIESIPEEEIINALLDDGEIHKIYVHVGKYFPYKRWFRYAGSDCHLAEADVLKWKKIEV